MKNIYMIPPNEAPIDEIYAVLSKDEKGDGIISAITDIGGMPMISGNKKFIEPFKEIAKRISKDTGRKLYLVKFTNKELLEVIG